MKYFTDEYAQQST